MSSPFLSEAAAAQHETSKIVFFPKKKLGTEAVPYFVHGYRVSFLRLS
jgi:hypothetical protein